MEYKDRIEEINQTGEFRAFITVEEDIRKKMNTERELGIEEGIEKGVKQGISKREMILKMSSRMPINQISEIAGMEIEEVEKIIEESKEN